MSAHLGSAEQARACTAGALCDTARDVHIDGLRGWLTVLVIFHHSAITYGAIGGWFYHETLDHSSFAARLLTYFCTVNQAFFMGAFFLFAGYFAYEPLQRKGPLAFVQARALRLGLPVLLFGFGLGPLSSELVALGFAAGHRPLPSGDVRRSLFELGPLWFALALLIFCVVLAVGVGCMQRLFPTRRTAAGPAMPRATLLLFAAAGVGAAAFCVRLGWPVGVEVAGMQPAYFASYIALFAFGYAAWRGRWLASIDARQCRAGVGLLGMLIPALPLVAALGPWDGSFVDRSIGGWTWPAALYALWEPFVALGALGVLLYRGKSAGPPARVTGVLARRAYAMYVIHPPILISVSLELRQLQIATPLKFVLAGTGASIFTFILAGLILRIPYSRRIF